MKKLLIISLLIVGAYAYKHPYFTDVKKQLDFEEIKVTINEII